MTECTRAWSRLGPMVPIDLAGFTVERVASIAWRAERVVRRAQKALDHGLRRAAHVELVRAQVLVLALQRALELHAAGHHHDALALVVEAERFHLRDIPAIFLLSGGSDGSCRAC